MMLKSIEEIARGYQPTNNQTVASSVIDIMAEMLSGIQCCYAGQLLDIPAGHQSRHSRTMEGLSVGQDTTEADVKHPGC